MFSIQMSVTEAGTSYFNLKRKSMSWVHACVEFSHPKIHLEKWYFLDLTWKPNLQGGYAQKVPASLFFQACKKKRRKELISWIIFFLWWQDMTRTLWHVSQLNYSLRGPWVGSMRFHDVRPLLENWNNTTTKSSWASTRHVYMRSFWQPHHDHQWSTCRCYLHWWKINRDGLVVDDKDVEDQWKYDKIWNENCLRGDSKWPFDP